MRSDKAAGAPERIWADQDNLTWVEECDGEAIKSDERLYILATPTALAATTEAQKLIREAEARGMQRAATACDYRAAKLAEYTRSVPDGAHHEPSAMHMACVGLAAAIRAEAAAILEEPK